MTDHPSIVLKEATKSVKWSALMEIASRTAAPIIYVVLARLLTPQDFGVVATAMIAISFSQIFWDAGLSKALVQTRDEIEKSADVVFWTNLSLGIVIFGIIFLSAPHVANFFHSPNSIPVLRVLGLQVLIDSFSSVQQALFMRNLKFRPLFQVTLTAALVPGLFSIPMAFAGYGVWALVAGSLSGSLLKMVLLWVKNPWRPRRRFDFPIAIKLFRFGYWVVGEGLAAWFFLWGDSFIVGKFLGIADLGIYRIGCMISTMIFGFMLNPLLPVLYPALCRIHSDPIVLKDIFHRVNRIVVSVSLPTGTGLLLVSPYLSAVLFGDKWTGVGLVVGVIGFMLGMGWMIGINGELYRAMGRPDLNTKLMFASIVFYLPAYLAAAPHGLEAFTLTRLGAAMLFGIPIQVFVCARLLGISIFYLWHDSKPAILATLSMSGIVTGLRWYLTTKSSFPHNAATLVILVATGIVAYGLSLWFLDRTFVRETKNLIRKVVLA